MGRMTTLSKDEVRQSRYGDIVYLSYYNNTIEENNEKPINSSNFLCDIVLQGDN